MLKYIILKNVIIIIVIIVTIIIIIIIIVIVIVIIIICTYSLDTILPTLSPTKTTNL